MNVEYEVSIHYDSKVMGLMDNIEVILPQTDRQKLHVDAPESSILGPGEPCFSGKGV